MKVRATGGEDLSLTIPPDASCFAYYGVTMPEFADFNNIALAGEKCRRYMKTGFPMISLSLRMAPSSGLR